MAEATLDTKLARRAEKRIHGKKRRSDKKRGLPAIVVFWLIAPIGAAGVAMPVVMDVQWVWLTAAAIVLQIWMLLINDRKGFIRSREMRRAYEARRHFSILETIVLFLLIMADMLAAAYALLMAAAP
ncbi:MAG: hypothetical protein O3B41_01985 [Bacteroidetes bacterium]|nr:hypothetical protein [Bacteroidota bacterium]